ncbi:MAG: SIR2 family protein [Bifidobacterium aquikefiri]|uniref:SIR2-like domain-containing protein n=1 Tax=Bifidobacterium aquikefiri TaxID=1653207 RepID=A0A261GAC3_9BIFI|nr:SIR2 family protein [Bifidobacterium aquikefiri]OZG68368.1 SIR2-like domain-containing protein [Bifidobacterium aquikefiri]
MSKLALLGGYTKGWQEIENDTPADENERSIQEAVLSALSGELTAICNSETLVVLAGSGTSLGIKDSSGKCPAPSMGGLWEEVKNLPSFNKVRGQLSSTPISNQNLEHVLSDAQSRHSLEPSNSDLEAFISEAESIVWNKCNFINETSDLVTHELFLRKVARRSTRLQRTQIYTTNYDLAFETAAQRSRFNAIDGFGYGGQTFNGASFDLDYVRRRPHEPLTLEPNVFHLLKLHGSVDWNSVGTEIHKLYDSSKPANPALIYPSATKYQLSYQQPYLEFMSRFQIALRQPDVGLIVVGFGFNDDHLTAPIEAALRSNIGLRAVFVSPGIRGTKRSTTFSWIQQLIERGDRRLTLLETTFDRLVEVLPDVPSREERDAYAERLADGGAKF